MRITNNMLINNMINYMGNNLARMNAYQNQMGTGKKIQVPSDDPVIAARALKLRTDVAEIEQYDRNVKDANSWLDITEDTLAKMVDVLQRGRELAVDGANGSKTPEDMQKIGEEIKQLRIQLVHLGNATYAGRYIFSGYKTDAKLLNDDETSPDFGKFSINVADSETIKYEVGIGDDIYINVPGGDLFHNGGSAVTGDTPAMIKTFNELFEALDTGDRDKVDALLANIDTDMNNLLRVRADVGARTNRVELTSNRLDSDFINFTRLMSGNEDVDMAETIMNLKNEENVYRASLAGGARIIMPTLVDFLR